MKKIELFDETNRRTQQAQRFDLVVEYNRVGRAYNALLDRGETADLTSDERAEMEKLQARLAEIDKVLAGSVGNVQLHHVRGESGKDYERAEGPETWRDTRTGKVVHLLAKGDSLVKEIRSTREGIAVPQYGIGDVCRMLALGAQTEVEKRALLEGTPSAGGYLVPTIVSAQLVDAMRAVSAVFQAGARILELEEWKVNLARVATDAVAGWRAENAVFAESDPAFDLVSFVAQGLGFYFKVSRELLQDAVNINQAIQTVIAAAMAAALDQDCLNGNGTAPHLKGVANVTGVGSYSMGTNGAVLANFDPFCEAVKLLIDGNAPLPGAFVMATRTFSTASKLKDTTNQPLRKPPLIENIPFIPTTRLPVNETQGTANNASRVLCGDWSQCVIGTRLPVTVKVLEERYAEYGEVAFLAFARYDMQLLHAGAFSQIVGIVP